MAYLPLRNKEQYQDKRVGWIILHSASLAVSLVSSELVHNSIVSPCFAFDSISWQLDQVWACLCGLKLENIAMGRFQLFCVF